MSACWSACGTLLELFGLSVVLHSPGLLVFLVDIGIGDGACRPPAGFGFLSGLGETSGEDTYGAPPPEYQTGWVKVELVFPTNTERVEFRAPASSP